MSLGYAPYLLHHIKNINFEATPQMKMEASGFLNMLLSNRKPSEVKLNNSQGHRKTVRVKAKQRYTKEMTETSKDCDTVLQPSFYETELPLDITRQIALHVDDETIAKYEEDASRMVSAGNPATQIMNEHLEDIMTAANAIVDAINDDLVTKAAAEIGTNRATGNSNAKTVNIDINGTQNDLDDGLTEILHDYKFNGGRGRPKIVGAGLFFRHNLQVQKSALSANQSGVNRAALSNYDFFYDLAIEENLASNDIVVYEPDAVQIVEYMEYTGFKAGKKPGGSFFATISLPIADVDGNIRPMDFDFQLKYSDCQKEYTKGYYGGTVTLEKGWNIILSKQCGLYSIPDNAYRGIDPLKGNRGSYRFNITNT